MQNTRSRELELTLELMQNTRSRELEITRELRLARERLAEDQSLKGQSLLDALRRSLIKEEEHHLQDRQGPGTADETSDDKS